MILVPRPLIVNKLIHHRYTWDNYTNALIRTLLTFGFQSGLRPEELIILKVGKIKFKEGYILINEQKKKYRERQVWLEDAILYSKIVCIIGYIYGENKRQRRNQVISYSSQEDGKLFSSKDARRMFLSRYCKPVWRDFSPGIIGDWSAIARLIRTKIETKKWDTRTVKHALGHKYEKTTELYIKFAEEYYRKDPYDWLRAVLKFI